MSFYRLISVETLKQDEKGRKQRMKRKCITCGCDISKDAKFCPSCGTTIEMKEERAGLFTNRRELLIIVVGIVVAVCIGILIAKSWKDTKNQNQNNQQSNMTENEVEDREDEEVIKYRYQWLVEPSIEADQIYYNVNSEKDAIFNDYHKQCNCQYAVIEKDGMKGVIDETGTMLTELKYNRIVHLETDDLDSNSFMMMTMDGQYVELYSGEWPLTVNCVENGLPYMDDDEIEDFLSETEGLTYYIGWNAGYYFDGEIRYVHTSNYGKHLQSDVFDDVIPVQQADKRVSTLAEWLALDGKYAISNKAKLVTDFIYDECGSMEEGLMAVCQNGKWGYVDEKGEVVIPIEYDASWNRYIENEAEASNVDVNSTNREYCYAASNGYIALRKGTKWKLCDLQGNDVISFGEFEEILPVNEHGRCWVKKNGKYGVIELCNGECDSNEYTDWKGQYSSYVTEKDSETTYQFIYVNNDVVPELIVFGAHNDDGITMLTQEHDERNDEITFDEDMTGKKAIRYIPRENVVKITYGNMDDYSEEIYSIFDGYWRQIASGRYYAEDKGNVQTDSDGNVIYKYEWEGEDVSKEEYEDKIEQFIPSEKAVLVDTKESLDMDEMFKILRYY